MLFSGSKEHGKTCNRRTNVKCVWMIWSGTTGWALKSDSWEDMRFKDRFLAWMGRAKMARWGQGAVNSRGKRQTNVHKSAEKRKARVRTGRCWRELC
jgi:hypothetical protein